jgi:chemotaxis protein MotB
MADAEVLEREEKAQAAEQPQPAAAPAADAAATDAPAEAETEAQPQAAPEEKKPIQPIRKIIVEDGHGGAHGGAWKIALADMMTAMMAFFLLMWLLGASNEDKKRSVADYFRPASHSQIVFGELAGSNGMFGGQSIIDTDGFPFTAKQTSILERLTPNSEGGPGAENGDSKENANREGPQRDRPDTSPNKPSGQQLSGQNQGSGPGPSQTRAVKQDAANFEKAEKQIMQALSQNPALDKLKEQVSITRDAEGMRIEVIDKADFAMFGSGTSDLTPRGYDLLIQIAGSLKDLPNKITVRGHTDSRGFARDSLRNNWTLSTERADTTRQILQTGGVNVNRFSRIEGVADTNPNVPNSPGDPRNRRVSITVLNQ